MELCKEHLILLLFILSSVEETLTDHTTEKFAIVVPEESATQEKISPAQNKTIDKLVEEQTDLIKKIISSHKATTIDYPVVTRKEAEVKEDAKIKEEKERESIEELRQKCHEFLKIQDGNNTQKVAERSETVDRISTVEAFGPNRKPEFLQKPKPEVLQAPRLPPDFSNPSQVEQLPKKYFLITRNRPDNQTVTINNTPQPNVMPKPQNLISQTQIVQNPSHQNIKYVQLEPIILQKMILNNGRMLFYWYKSIPMFPQYVPLAKYQTQPSQVSDIHSTFQYPSRIPYQPQTYPPQASYSYNSQILNSSQILTAQPTNPVPNPQNYQPQILNHQATTPQNVQPPPAVVPNYEIEYGTTEKPEDLFKKQMKFVIPVPYPAGDGTEAPARYPWQFDPFAYYPKSLQPSTINVPLPYVPTFHMVRTLQVPNNLIK